MITYQYHCDDCGAELERDYPIGLQPHEIDCVCGGVRIQVLSAASFQLKGHGWAKDGHASQK